MSKERSADMEIERKFWLPNGIPEEIRGQLPAPELLVQRYLALYEQEKAEQIFELGLPERALLILFGYEPGEVRHRYVLPLGKSLGGDSEHPRKDVITVKSKGGVVRKEWEVDISLGQSEWFLNFAVDLPISKIRTRYPLGAVVAEIDEFQAQLISLTTVEVAFSSEEEARSFILPELFAGAIDVSDRQEFKNRELARNGLPEEVWQLLGAC